MPNPAPGNEILKKFFTAVSREVNGVIREMVDQYPDAVHWQAPGWMDQNNRTALLSAVMCNNVALATFLLDRGADIEARDVFKRTPLIISSDYACDPRMTAALLSRGAKIDAANHGGKTALTVAQERRPADTKDNMDVEAVVALLRRAEIQAALKRGTRPGFKIPTPLV